MWWGPHDIWPWLDPGPKTEQRMCPLGAIDRSENLLESKDRRTYLRAEAEPTFEHVLTRRDLLGGQVIPGIFFGAPLDGEDLIVRVQQEDSYTPHHRSGHVRSLLVSVSRIP